MGLQCAANILNRHAKGSRPFPVNIDQKARCRGLIVLPRPDQIGIVGRDIGDQAIGFDIERFIVRPEQHELHVVAAATAAAQRRPHGHKRPHAWQCAQPAIDLIDDLLAWTPVIPMHHGTDHNSGVKARSAPAR